MKNLAWWLMLIIAIVVVVITGFAGHYLWQVVLIGAAYKAKIICSGVFVSGRDPNSLLNEELAGGNLSLLEYLKMDIDHQGKSATASIMCLAKRKAVFRPGLGCTLVTGASEERLRLQQNPFQTPPPKAPDKPWPEGEAPAAKLPPEVAAEKLSTAIGEAFTDPDPSRLRRTRVVVVVHKGRIIAERYAPGFSQDMPLAGWSMAKGVTNALIGILVGEAKLALHGPAPVPQWRASADPRGNITLDQLLHMSSGLAFTENYTNPLQDVTRMLFGSGDVAAYAAGKPLKALPGSRWSYASGTTNILTRIARQTVGGTDAEYFAFPRHALFDRIGMHSAIIEPDAAGTFVGSSFMYATARDWARFGLLYLQDGVWKGERILPEGWVKYSVTPAPPAQGREYGAHFWLKIPSPFNSTKSPPPSLPADTFHMIGHEGQFVTIVPSRQLVVVRLGLTRQEGGWDHESFIAQIVEAVSRQSAAVTSRAPSF